MASLGPFAEISRIQNEINRLIENLLELRSSGSDAGGDWLPNSDVYETDKNLVVTFEVPGVDPENVSIAINGNSLVLRGDKRRRDPSEETQFHCMERGFGRFKRVVHISTPVNTHAATAMLTEGVLKVTFPKVPNRRGEEVPIPIKDPA
jgi:HSP20 family protein